MTDLKNAIEAVNRILVTVEQTAEVGLRNDTFITQRGGKMYPILITKCYCQESKNRNE